MRRMPCLAAPLLIAQCLGASAAEDCFTTDWFTTSSGARAPTPLIETLDCRQMAEVLTGIDHTGYRRGAGRPDHEDDLVLLRYENRLAARYYHACVAAPGGDSAFSGGYEGEGRVTGRR